MLLAQKSSLIFYAPCTIAIEIFKSNWILFFPDSTRVQKKIISLIKKEILSLKHSTRFVDYYGADDLVNRLDSLRVSIANDLNAKSPKAAFEIMLEFLDLHESILGRVDDSNGSVGNVFMAACADLGSLSEGMTHLSVPEIIEMVFSRFMDNGYAVYDDIILHFKNSLTDHGLILLREKFEQALNDKNQIQVKLGLEAIADCQNDVDAFIHACKFKDKPSAHDHLDIAKRLINHWRAQEALEWLDTMDIPANHPWQNDRRKLRIQALELDGKYEAAQNERLAWFDKNLSPELYGQISKNAQPDFQESFRISAIKKAFDFYEPHVALHFLMEIQEFEESAQFVRLKHHDLNGSQYYTLRLATDSLQDIDPTAATLLYRKMIQPILEETKSKYYRYAAKDLVACGILSAKISAWDDLESHDDYLKNIEEKHKRKVSFWSQYQSALQKYTNKIKG